MNEHQSFQFKGVFDDYFTYFYLYSAHFVDREDPKCDEDKWVVERSYGDPLTNKSFEFDTLEEAYEFILSHARQ